MNDMVDLNGIQTVIEGIGNQISTSINVEKVRRKILHRNLLDNWYFPTPINQRALTKYTPNESQIYTIDRWAAMKYIKSVELTSDGLLITENGTSSVGYRGLIQKLDPTVQEYIMGKTMTMSALAKGHGKCHVGCMNYMYSEDITCDSDDLQLMSFTFPFSTDATNSKCVPILTTISGSITWMAAKLELGDYQTLAYQNENGEWILMDPPPDIATELQKCQRYQLRISGSQNYFRAGTGSIAGTIAYIVCPTPVTMRTRPVTTWSGNFRIDPVSAVVTAIETNQYSESNITLQVTVDSYTARGNGCALSASNDPNAYIFFDANL